MLLQPFQVLIIMRALVKKSSCNILAEFFTGTLCITPYTIHEKLKAHLRDWALNAEGWHLNKRLFSKLIDKNI